IGVDNNGNVYVTGSSFGIGTARDFLTLAYSSAGTPLWTNRYNGPTSGEDSAYALAVDSNGNVFVTGESIATNSLFDMLTIGYSSAGAQLWARRVHSTAGHGGKAIAVDGSGNVFAAGYGISSSYDYQVAAYANGGAPLWSAVYDGPSKGNDFATAI